MGYDNFDLPWQAGRQAGRQAERELEGGRKGEGGREGRAFTVAAVKSLQLPALRSSRLRHRAVTVSHNYVLWPRPAGPRARLNSAAR